MDDDAQRVVLIVDREATCVLVVELFNVLAQDAHAETMKRRDEWQVIALLCAQQSLHALAHLVGGFVCERNGEDVPARDFLLGNEVRDAMRDNARFTRPGARENQERAFSGKHSLALLFI